MRLGSDESRELFFTARVARLATITADLRPHLVPVVFAVADHTVYSAVDAKPKSTTALRRLDNIAGHASVALLVDHYDDDWTQLWWARADGSGRIATGAEDTRARALLTERYPVYERQPPPGPVLAIDVERWSGWSAALDD